MAVMLRARRLGKTRVVAGHKVGCKGIGVGHVADSAKPQLPDQAILQSEVRTPTRPLAWLLLAQLSMFNSYIARPNWV